MTRAMLIGMFFLQCIDSRDPVLGFKDGRLFERCILVRWCRTVRVHRTGVGTSLDALLMVQLNTTFRLFVFFALILL